MSLNVPAVTLRDRSQQSRRTAGLAGNRCGRARMSSGQCARQSELGEHVAVGEPDDGADAVVFKGEHDHPVGPCDRCLGAGAVAAEGGLGVGSGGCEAQGSAAQAGPVVQEPGDRCPALVFVW